MTKPEKKALVPALRFPEFQDTGAWKTEELGTKTKKVGSGITPTGGDKNYKSSGRPFVRSQNVGWGCLILDDVAYIDDETHSSFSATEIRKDDVLLNITGASIGRSTVANQLIEGGNVNQHVCIIRTKQKELNPFFLNQLLLSQVGQNQIDSFQTGGNRQGLNFAQIRSFSTPIPPQIEEQQKIADCLSSIDDLITAQTQKLAVLKAHKKGLMQQLFPAEGETVPELRFPEFRDGGEWKSQKLEDLAKRGSGHTPNKAESGYYNGGVKWVSLADSNKLDNGYIYDTKIEISGDGLKNSSAVLHPAGTVILSRDAGVGKSAVIHCSMAVSQHFIVWACNPAKLKNWFLYYTLQNLKPTFESIAVGSTIKTIGLPYFKELFISTPSVEEQQKIADCLSSIDELITAQSQKIEVLKSHKKGLMQQLFPSMDEVEV